MATKSAGIHDLASSVRDNRRRGNPRPGCDCEQCFGYCMVDREAAARMMAGSSEGRPDPWRDGTRREGD